MSLTQLMQAFNFSASDIQANRNGYLSMQQQELIERSGGRLPRTAAKGCASPLAVLIILGAIGVYFYSQTGGDLSFLNDLIDLNKIDLSPLKDSLPLLVVVAGLIMGYFVLTYAWRRARTSDFRDTLASSNVSSEIGRVTVIPTIAGRSMIRVNRRVMVPLKPVPAQARTAINPRQTFTVYYIGNDFQSYFLSLEEGRGEFSGLQAYE